MNPLFLFVFLIASPRAIAQSEAPLDASSRYGVRDRYTKIVDNRGKGEERLYGVRNARILFRNVLRGGANNAYHRTERRDNMNPLPEDGLRNLCEEGFTESNYLYSTRFENAPKEIHCKRFDGRPSTLKYLNLRYAHGEDEKVLQLIHRHITGKTEGGLYLHCWNGWHASGYMSAISLMQFCGMSPSDAVDYWNRNTDGVNTGPRYDRIREKILEFKPLDYLKLSPSDREKACSL